MWVIELLQSIGLAGQITVVIVLLIAAFYLKRLLAIGVMLGSIVSIAATVLIIIAAELSLAGLILTLLR